MMNKMIFVFVGLMLIASLAACQADTPRRITRPQSPG